MLFDLVSNTIASGYTGFKWKRKKQTRKVQSFHIKMQTNVAIDSNAAHMKHRDKLTIEVSIFPFFVTDNFFSVHSFLHPNHVTCERSINFVSVFCYGNKTIISNWIATLSLIGNLVHTYIYWIQKTDSYCYKMRKRYCCWLVACQPARLETHYTTTTTHWVGQSGENCSFIGIEFNHRNLSSFTTHSMNWFATAQLRQSNWGTCIWIYWMSRNLDRSRYFEMDRDFHWKQPPLSA